MKYIICDITGRTINYDIALSEAINKELADSDKIEFWSAGLDGKYEIKVRKFFSCVPQKVRSISHPLTRMLKAFDTICAYIKIVLCVAFRKVDVFHLQWFPFLSLGLTGSNIDIKFISLLKFISPKTKFVFTIHNVCPHGMKESDIPTYNRTFSKALRLFDDYIVHTESTKDYVVSTLGLKVSNVHVIYHGIFKPKDFEFSSINIERENIKIIMYGFQSYYKGTDVFLKALSFIKEEYKNKIKVSICGAFSDDYYQTCTNIDTGVDIKWIPQFLSDKELYENIDEANLIILPYRRISQSGVLLLALNTRRYIIASDIPSFQETLKGFPEETFFKTEDPKDLARVINAYYEKQIDFEKIKESIEYLNVLYSWQKSAINTINLYKS